MNIYTKSSRNGMERMEDSMRYMSIMVDSLGSDRLFIAAVADGVGSLSRSSESSRYAVASLFQEAVELALSEEFASAGVAARNSLIATWADIVLDRLSTRLRDRFFDCDVGSTLTFAVDYSGTVTVCGCGDSPAILVRGSSAELFIPLDRAEGTQNTIVQYLGSPKVHLKGNIRAFEPERGDRLLIGSDGAFGRVSLEDVARLAVSGAGGDAVESILAAAASTTGDNQSLVLLHFIGDETKNKETWLPWKRKKG
ncbi:MAG: protein phosphatase 2C domain-containing protein [Eubacteriaceae bacterium]|nr:protein phosphatase 2C domain-containing protein [Eubacteriaceae bacterium]